MMRFKKKSLALALGTVLGGMGLIPAAQAVNLATDGLGEALIIPYYTVRNGWNTLLNLTNTSDQVIAVKVRFHEGYNSRDVFDFNVVLSPYDVWNGWVENGAGNIPVFRTNDTSCTVPEIVPGGSGQPFQGGGANGRLSYTGAAADGGPTDDERMREGYFAVILMGSTSPTSTYGAYAVHGTNGVPANCSELRKVFSVPTGISALRTAFPGYVANPLKGSFSLVNGKNGWVASGEMTTLANFYKIPPGGNSLVTLQLPPTGTNGTGNFMTSYLEPDLHATNTPGFVLVDTSTTAGPAQAQVGTTAKPGPDQVLGGIDAISFVLGRTEVINQWARNTDGTNGWVTNSDWVVTFPTKRFYTDQATGTQYAGRAAGRTFTPAGVGSTARWLGITANASPYPGITSTANPFAQTFTTAPNVVGTGKSCDPVTFQIWNREEKIIVGDGGPVFSPAPSTPGNELCGEVNVLTFNDASSTLLGSAPALTANINELPGPNGWMAMNLQNATSNAGFGLPAIGFSITTRTTSSNSLNEAFLVDHAYKRAPIENTPGPGILVP